MIIFAEESDDAIYLKVINFGKYESPICLKTLPFKSMSDIWHVWNTNRPAYFLFIDRFKSTSLLLDHLLLRSWFLIFIWYFNFNLRIQNVILDLSKLWNMIEIFSTTIKYWYSILKAELLTGCSGVLLRFTIQQDLTLSCPS